MSKQSYLLFLDVLNAWCNNYSISGVIISYSGNTYRGVFQHVVFLCPSIADNRLWIWADPDVCLVIPGECLHEWLKFFFKLYRRESTLYAVDDITASQILSKRKTMHSLLGTRGRHPKQLLWVLTQKYNSCVKEVRACTKRIALFHMKDRNSFEEAFRENNAVPTLEKRAEVKQLLATIKHAKLILKTDPPTAYKVLV